MSTLYIITFYAVISLLVLISMIAGFKFGRNKTKHPNVSPNKKSKMRKTIINTDILHIPTESQRDHEWDKRAPP